MRAHKVIRRKYNKWSRRIERNLIVCYARANEFDRTEGLYWYAQAHSDACKLSERYEVSIAAACGVISALSPGSEWSRNLLDARELLSAFRAGSKIPPIGTYGRRNVEKALACARGSDPLSVLGGQKVRAFYACILDPSNASEVCIDRHAKCAAYGIRKNRDANALVTPAEYPFVAWHYRKLAERYGVLPHQLQAVIWVTWRRLRGELKKLDLPFGEDIAA